MPDLKRTMGLISAAVFLTGTAAFAQDTGPDTTPSGGPDTTYKIVPTTGTSVGNSAASTAYKQGIADFQAGRLAQSATEMQIVEKQAPNNVTAHSILGYIYLKQSKSQDAVAEMETVVRLAPKDPGGHKNLGRAYLQTGQYDKAAAQFNTVLADSPMDTDALFGLAVAQGQLGQNDAAAATLEKVVAAKPSSPAYQNLAVVLQKSGKKAEAADAFQKAAELDPKNTLAVLNAGLLYAQVGANDKAIPDLNQAIAQDTDYKYEAHLTLAQSYHSVNNDAKAISEFGIASQIRPTEAAPLYNLAALQQQAGQTADAEQSYQKVLDLKPTDPQIVTSAQTNLGILLANDGKTDQAMPLLTAAIQADPKAAPPHAALGNLYAKQGDAAKAMDERKTAVDLDPSDSQTRLLLADAYLAGKQYTEAAAQYGEVAKNDPQNTSVLNALGTAYEQGGDSAQAQTAFEAALAGTGTARDKAQAQNNLGVVYEKQGHQAKAIAAYKKAVALDPTLTEAKKNLARFHAK
jgi:tetratricopeptide (TPR) repeat protein